MSTNPKSHKDGGSRRFSREVFAGTAGKWTVPTGPDGDAFNLSLRAYDLEAEGERLAKNGQHAEAASTYTQAISLRSKLKNRDIKVAVIKNELGEVYMKVGNRLDDAQKLFEEAERAQAGQKIGFDVTLTRNNLGQLFEIKGDLQKAVEWRTKGAPDHMLCSYMQCPKTIDNLTTKSSDLHRCKRCKCTFYCGSDCQMKAWDQHKLCCRESPVNVCSA